MYIPFSDAMEGARTVKRWAYQAGVSRSHLTRTVTKATGRTPQNLLRLAHVLRAMEMVQGGMRIADAAYATGYPDPFTFSNACVRALGRRPSELRYEDLRTVARAA